MSQTYPPEIRDFVDEELQRGRYADEGELVVAALRAYRELQVRHDALHSEVERSIAQAERGEIAVLDTEATKAEARRRFMQET